MKKIKFLLIFILIFGFKMSLVASLNDDKENILRQYNYIEESAEEPVLRELYHAALEEYEKNNFENAIFYYQKIFDIREVYKETIFLLEAIEKMLNYPIYDAKNIVIDEYLEKGREYYENRQYLAALNIWEKILLLNPVDKEGIQTYINDCRRLLADPYYERGWEYFKKKKYLEAIDEWEYVLGLVPEYRGLKSLLEKTREKANELSINQLLAKAKKNYDLDKMKKALNLVIKALEIDPKNDQASGLKKKVINKMKRQYTKYYNKGFNDYKNKEYEKAVSNLITALKYTVTDKQVRKARKYISKSRHELSKIKVELPAEPVKKKKKVVKTEKFVDQEEVRKHYTQGLYYYRNGYIKKAIAEWEIVLSMDPENERAYTSLQRAKADLVNEE